MKGRRSGSVHKKDSRPLFRRGNKQKVFDKNKKKVITGKTFKNKRERNSKTHSKFGNDEGTTKRKFQKKINTKEKYNNNNNRRYWLNDVNSERMKPWGKKKHANINGKHEERSENVKRNPRQSWEKKEHTNPRNVKRKNSGWEKKEGRENNGNGEVDVTEEEPKNETYKYKKYSWLYENSNKETSVENNEDEPDEYERKKEKKKFVLFKKRKNSNNSTNKTGIINTKKNKQDKICLSTFKNLGLSENMCKSITKNLKYNKPTEIQKVCIPPILRGKDVICISKTGSGKSLVYLSTLIDKLKDHNVFFGIRGLIILPTKELVVQIYRLAKKICRKFFNLNINIIIGGVSVVSQFELLKENIDILICCPGRFSHILEETQLSLEKVEMLIIDEADRLLELNYYNEMNIIYKRLNKANKQTILISATLPTQVENYFKLKLVNAEICHVSSDTIISDQLNMHFLFCRTYEKWAVLMKVVLLFKKKKLGKTIIFFCTKYHILFFSKILQILNIHHSVLYGNADVDFRMEQIQAFTDNPKIQFFLVTDLAARGINITSVHNVINYNLPFSSKLFIHRVGRACREQQSGYAVSIVTYKDILYAYEIAFFIGKNLRFSRFSEETIKDIVKNQETNKEIEKEAKKMEQLFEKIAAEKKCENEESFCSNESEIEEEEEEDEEEEERDRDGDGEGEDENGNENEMDNSSVEEVNESSFEQEENDDNKNKEGHKDGNREKDTIYIGSIGNVNEFMDFIEDKKKNDEELISLTKSITASYKIYYKMRPKVSTYTCKKCVSEINEAGGLYKLASYIHPDELYKEQLLNTKTNEKYPFHSTKTLNEKQQHEKTLNEKVKEVDTIFTKLENIVRRKEQNEANKKETGIEEQIENREIYEKNEADTETTNKKDVQNFTEQSNSDGKNETRLARNVYTQEEIVSYLHEFQRKSDQKTNSIPEEIRDKLNKMKEKSEHVKLKRRYNANEADELSLSDDFSLHISEGENGETTNVLNNEFSLKGNEKGTEKPKTKKKISKRAKKKMTENKKMNEMKKPKPFVQSEKSEIENLPLEEIIKKINEKKIEKEKKIFELETPGFDLLPDEEEEMNKQRYVKKKIWNSQKKRYEVTEVDTFTNKVVDNSTAAGKLGKMNSRCKNLYEKWVQKTKSRIKKIGELEDGQESKKGIKAKNRILKFAEADNKEEHLKMLESVHPEITEAISKGIKLTAKQNRLYKKYITGKYKESRQETKTPHHLSKEKEKQHAHKIKSDVNYRKQFLKKRKQKIRAKMEKKMNLSSQRTRSVAIVKPKKIQKRR